MNFIQCAGRYFMRRKSRSILLILLLTTVFTLILSVVSVAAHAGFYIKQIKNNFSREFVVSFNNAPGSLTLERIYDISAREDIAAYRLISNATPVEFVSDNGTPLSVETDGDGCLVSPGFEHAGTLVSNVTSDTDELFSDGTLRLVSGRHILENDERKILIHKKLAVKNSLQTGDTILLNFPQAIIEDMNSMGYDISHLKSNKLQVEIAGIFESQDTNDTGLHLSHQIYENYCYIDLKTYSSVFSPASERFFFQAAFSIASSSELAVVTKEIKNLDWQAGQPDSIVSDLDYYGGMIGALSSLSNLLKIVLIVIIVVCMTLLYFLLSHGVKQRKQEIGIMMSLGLSGGRILLQHIAEVMIAAMTAMLLALAVSGGIAHIAGDRIVSATVKQNDGLDQSAADPAGGRSPQTEIKNQGASVSEDAAGIMLLYGFLLVPASVIIAELPVLRKEPTENL